LRKFTWAFYADIISGNSNFITQRLRKNHFFVKKKPFFFGVMQVVFYYANRFFMFFGLLVLASYYMGKKSDFWTAQKTNKTPCKTIILYKKSKSVSTQSMARDDFWSIFPFFEPLFYMTFITINPVSIFNRCMGPFFGDHF
jgi:hypothetical protein